MAVIYIGVGSNQGDRHENIQRSRLRLGDAGVNVRRVSPLYETAAECKPGQSAPNYLNAVFEAETLLDPEDLLDALEKVERDLGRRSKGDWAPRSIDLDILLYADRIVETDRLKIPHPEMAGRWFVLKPLADLAPDVVHPGLKKTIRELLNSL